MMRRSEFFQELKKVIIGSNDINGEDDTNIFQHIHAKYVAWAVEHNLAAQAVKEKWTL